MANYVQQTYSLVLSIEFQSLHEWSKPTNSGNLEDLQEWNVLDWFENLFNVTVGNGGEEIDEEHALDVLFGNKCRWSNFIAQSIEKCRAEANQDIKDEENVDDQVERLVAWHCFKLFDDVLKRHCKWVENGHDQDK